jgi:prepilin-type N-terminal cleavage/methylation domain-containing protein
MAATTTQRKRVNPSWDWACQGFTLMELLVSMTLMSILTVAVFMGFRMGFNAWNKSEEAMEKTRQVHIALDLLSRQIGSLVPCYSKQKAEENPVDLPIYQGEVNGMRFVSNFSALHRGAGGARLVEYFVTPSTDSQTKTLWVNERELPDDTALSDWMFAAISRQTDGSPLITYREFFRRPEAIPLVENLKAAEFRYLERPSLDVPPGGVETPASPVNQTPWPAGVEIRLQWKENGFFNHPDFLVVVPVQADYTKKML